MKATSATLLLTLSTLSLVATAQPQVAVYGIVDGGVQLIRPATIDGVGKSSTTAVSGGYAASSRWGLRGREDLSDGMRLVFDLESGFNLDDGAVSQKDRLFGREASIGIETRYGSLGAGRVGVLSSGVGSYNLMRFSPFGVSWGDAGMKAFSFTSLRTDNTLVYRSPTLEGLTASAMHSFRVDGTELAGAKLNRRYSGVGANYDRGPLLVGLYYETVTAAANETVPDEKNLTLGAYYSFPSLRAYVVYQRNTDGLIKGATTGSGATLRSVSADANIYLLGVKAKVPGGSLLASYQRRDGAKVQQAGKTFEGDLQIMSLGYSYDLSKRTYLYAAGVVDVGSQSWDPDARGQRLGMAAATQRSLYNQTVITLGLSHSF